MLLAALAAELKRGRPAANLDVPAAERGQAVGPVGACVLRAAYANKRVPEDAHGGSQHPFSSETLLPEVGGDGPADPRERASEFMEMVVFVAAAVFIPFGVIAVLLPPTRIAAGDLKVPVGNWTDPDILPGGWDDQGCDTLDLGGMTEPSAARVEVSEAPAVAPAGIDRGGIEIGRAHVWNLGTFIYFVWRLLLEKKKIFI